MLFVNGKIVGIIDRDPLSLHCVSFKIVKVWLVRYRNQYESPSVFLVKRYFATPWDQLGPEITIVCPD